jgi:hypothetical protein
MGLARPAELTAKHGARKAGQKRPPDDGHGESSSMIHDLHCERARAWTSLRPDGELSRHETALLEAHLQRCLGCRAFADQIDVLTSALRSAVRVDPPRAIAVPARRIRSGRGMSLAALESLVAATARWRGCRRPAAKKA